MWSTKNSNDGTGLVKFRAVIGSERIVMKGKPKTMTTVSQCITIMKDYEDKSLEELRFEDYGFLKTNCKGLLALPRHVFGTSSNSLSFDQATTSTYQVGTPDSLFGTTPLTRSVAPFGDMSYDQQPHPCERPGKRTHSHLQNNSAFVLQSNHCQHRQTAALTSTQTFAASSATKASTYLNFGGFGNNFVTSNVNNSTDATLGSETKTGSSCMGKQFLGTVTAPVLSGQSSRHKHSPSYTFGLSSQSLGNNNNLPTPMSVSEINMLAGNNTSPEIGGGSVQFGAVRSSADNHSTHSFTASSTTKTSTNINVCGFGNNIFTRSFNNLRSANFGSETKTPTSSMGKQLFGTVTVPVSSGQALFGNNVNLSTPMSISATDMLAENNTSIGVAGESARFGNVDKQTSPGQFSICSVSPSINDSDVEMS